MNVFLTRILFAVTVIVLVGCGIWLYIGVRSEAEGMSIPLAAVGMLCAYIFGLLLVFFGRRYGEAVADDERVLLRPALAPPRVIPLADIRTVTYFHNLLLPSRGGGTGAHRLVLHLNNGANVFISPQGSAVAGQLRGHGVDVEVVTDPITPARARARVPGSAGFVESLSWPVFVGVGIVLPIAVVTWVFVTQ